MGNENVEENSEVTRNKNKSIISITLLSTLIIIMGIFQQLLYYNNFNLPIKYFTGLSELGLIISDGIFFSLPVLVFPLIFIILMSEKKFIHATTPESIKFFRKIILIISFVIILICIPVFFLSKNYDERIYPLIYIFFISILSFIIFIGKHLQNLISINNITGIISVLMVVTLLGTRTSNDIRHVEHGMYKSTIIKTKDSTYISTDSSFFIGKTEKYVFIYNKKDSTTTIIPTESVELITMKINSPK